ncbi:MAG: DUF4365 domain-containing protein [Terriglobia bacterium]
MKKILHTDIVGKQGINLIEKVCYEMDFLWHATGLEAGIDGHIEIRNANTGEVTNLVIQVQSKATEQSFEAETETSLSYTCRERDLEYWLAGNAPVVLIRSRPKTHEAYWVPLKEYFTDLNRRKSRKIVFDKKSDRFDRTARDRLLHLAVPADSGLYLGASPKQETIYSDLLRLSRFPDCYFVARTEFRTRGEVFALLREITPNVRGEWILRDKQIYSFHDLTTPPWTQISEGGTVEEHNTSEWALTDSADRQKRFVELLNACLREQLYARGVIFSRENQYYFWRATPDLSPITFAYQSREKRAERTVFKGYPSKSDHTRMSYYRHSAFEGRFVRYDGQWFLQIKPTYHYTRDGWQLSRFQPDALSGIKRLEKNQAVNGQVIAWGHLLQETTLFDKPPRFLEFTALLEFPIDAGLDDESWLKRETITKRSVLEAPDPDQRVLL